MDSTRCTNTFDNRKHRLSTIKNCISLLLLSNRDDILFQKYEEAIINISQICSVIRYKRAPQLLRYVRRLPSNEYVIVILEENDALSLKTIIRQFQRCRRIQAILIVASSSTFNFKSDDSTSRISSDVEIVNVIEIFSEYESMFARLQQLVTSAKHQFENDVFITLNRQQKALKDLRQELGPFLWTHLMKIVLISTPHNSAEAKQQMLSECRKLYCYDRLALSEIKRFEETYRSCDAIKWYTKPCFLFSLINIVLRSEDPFSLYKFRYFIFDLSKQLAIQQPTPVGVLNLYRGAKIHRDEIEKLAIGSLVAVNGFFSSSCNREVAETFITLCPITGRSPSRNRNDNNQYVLFNILIDWSVSTDCVVANACTSSYIADEEEMIFDIGTTFSIIKIDYDPNRFLWNITMTFSTEVLKMVQEYDAYIRERLKEFNAHILFVRLLNTNFAEYSCVLALCHYFLRILPPNSEERPNVYFELARTYRFLGRHTLAIAYFRAAQLLQRRCLPRWKFKYATTLAGLSTVYSEIGNFKTALNLLERAHILFRDYPIDYNYETIFQANHFSYAYYLKKDYQKALDILTNILDVYKRKMPLDHPSHAQAWHNMGLVQRALGNTDHAIADFNEALRIRGARLSPDHPYIARTHYQLSLIHEDLNNIQLALEHAEASLSIRKLRLHSEHSELIESVQLLERLLSKKT